MWLGRFGNPRNEIDVDLINGTANRKRDFEVSLRKLNKLKEDG